MGSSGVGVTEGTDDGKGTSIGSGDSDGIGVGGSDGLGSGLIVVGVRST